MKDTLLFELLRSFEKSEWRAFAKFLKSPVHNNSMAMTLFYEALKMHYPNFEHPSLRKETLFKKLFLEETYQDKKMRDAISSFTRLAEDFIALEILQSNKEQKYMLLSKEYQKRRLHRHFHRTTSSMIEAIESKPYLSAADFRDLGDLYQRQSAVHSSYAARQTTAAEFAKTVHHVKMHFFLSQLQLCSHSIDRFLIINEPLSFAQHEIDTLLHETAKFEEESLLFKLYRQLIDLQLNIAGTGSINEYQALRDTFFNAAILLDESSRQTVWRSLKNIVARFTRMETKFSIYDFELYEFAMQHGFLLTDSRISSGAFFNAIVAGCYCQKYNWLESFFKSYHPNIEGQEAAKVIELSMAFLAFHKRQFGDVQQRVVLLHFDDVQFELVRRSLLLRTYLELYIVGNNNEDLLLSHQEAFAKYLKRKGLIGTKKAAQFSRFVELVRLIVSASSGLEVFEKLNCLRSKILTEHDVLIKEWLIDKIDALLSNTKHNGKHIQ